MSMNQGDRTMEIALTVRDLEPEDLTDLDWSGGPEHLNAIAEVLQRCWSGEVASIVITLPNGRLVAHGAVDFSKSSDYGELWMLSVHETFQSLGVGSMLIRALEDRARSWGVGRTRLGVEHDNPRAHRLYRRLGYRDCGTELDGWPVAGGDTYVTVCTVMEHRLGAGV
jgi:ribosomal protein S18 acetylase RimI-like enzyme